MSLDGIVKARTGRSTKWWVRRVRCWWMRRASAVAVWFHPDDVRVVMEPRCCPDCGRDQW